jgi:hypothetical protein
VVACCQRPGKGPGITRFYQSDYGHAARKPGDHKGRPYNGQCLSAPSCCASRPTAPSVHRLSPQVARASAPQIAVTPRPVICSS